MFHCPSKPQRPWAPKLIQYSFNSTQGKFSAHANLQNLIHKIIVPFQSTFILSQSYLKGLSRWDELVLIDLLQFSTLHKHQKRDYTQKKLQCFPQLFSGSLFHQFWASFTSPHTLKVTWKGVELSWVVFWKADQKLECLAGCPRRDAVPWSSGDFPAGQLLLGDLWYSGTAGELHKNHWELTVILPYPAISSDIKNPAPWTGIVLHSSPTEQLSTGDFRSSAEKHTMESSETIRVHLKQITDTLSAKQVFTLPQVPVTARLCTCQPIIPSSVSGRVCLCEPMGTEFGSPWALNLGPYLKQLNSHFLSLSVCAECKPCCKQTY